MALDGTRDCGREEVAIDRERRTRRYAGVIGRGDHERTEAAHLLLQAPDRRFQRAVAKRVRAHQLRQAVGLMRFGATDWSHLVEIDLDPATRELPRGLAAGEPAAYDGDTCMHVDPAGCLLRFARLRQRL